MLIPLIGLCVGMIIGFFVPFHIPAILSSYVAIAILATLDSVLNGITDNLQGKFNFTLFVFGVFGNVVLATLLRYISDKLAIDIYFAAIIIFGTRLFYNFAVLRRYLLSIQISKIENSQRVNDRQGNI